MTGDNNMHYKAFIITFIAIISCFYNVEADSEESEHDWDILIFTQQWPVTECMDIQEHHHDATCNMPSKIDSWSIHGVWPTKLGTIGPGFCNRTWLFDPEKVRPIENELMQSWTNIDAGSGHYSFWAHEWNKHGTCAAMLQSLNSEFKYFSKGLEWFSKFSMGDILAAGNITPSSVEGYNISEIHDTIKRRLGVNPGIECRKEDGMSLISEIRICFDKELNLHDCDGIKKQKNIDGQTIITNCDSSQRVFYLHYPPGQTLVQLFKLVGFIKWLTL